MITQQPECEMEDEDVVQVIADGKVNDGFTLVVPPGETMVSPIKFKKGLVTGIGVLQKGINYALEMFYEKHLYLVETDVNERSMTHKLAEELQKVFIDWSVDCEYNRVNDDEPKKLFLQEQEVFSDDQNAMTVYPDIIIHERGSRNDNLVAIEVKKSGRDTKDDEQKLKGFTSDLLYNYGLLIVLKADLQETLASMRYFSDGGEQSFQEIESREEEVADYWAHAPPDNETPDYQMEEFDRHLHPKNYDEDGDRIDVPEGMDMNGQEYLEWKEEHQ